MDKSVEQIFEETYIECRSLFISLRTPSLKNDQTEFDLVKQKHLLLLNQLKGMLELHPELQKHPLYAKVQSEQTW